MKTIRKLMILFLIIGFVQTGNIEAQSWKDLKNKAKKLKVNKKKTTPTKTNTTTTTKTKTYTKRKTSSSSNIEEQRRQRMQNANKSTQTKNTKPTQEKNQKWESLYKENINKVNNFRSQYCKGNCIVDDYKSAKIFSDNVNSLNYQKLIVDLNEIGEETPSIKNKNLHYKNIQSLGQDFEKGVDDFFIKIKPLMNKSGTAKNEKKLKLANEYAQAADLLAQGVLQMLPNNETAKNKKAETEKYFNQIEAEYSASVFTSKLHKENIEKILFSKSPIEIKKENADQFTNQFTANDKIYAMAYLNGSIKGLANGRLYGDKLRCDVYLDGQFMRTVERVQYTIDDSELDRSWFMMEIIPDPKTATGTTSAIMWGRSVLNEIPRGEHKLVIELSQCRETIAKGNINVNWDNYNAEKNKKNAEQACLYAENNVAMNRKLPPEYNLPSSKFSDPSMSTAKIKQMILASNKFTDCVKILKLTITNTQDWSLNKQNGIIQGRFNARLIRLVYKSKDGFCYYIPNVSFNCDYLGGGRYGKPNPHIAGNRKVKIACKNVK